MTPSTILVRASDRLAAVLDDPAAPLMATVEVLRDLCTLLLAEPEPVQAVFAHCVERQLQALVMPLVERVEPRITAEDVAIGLGAAAGLVALFRSPAGRSPAWIGEQACLVRLLAARLETVFWTDVVCAVPSCVLASVMTRDAQRELALGAIIH